MKQPVDLTTTRPTAPSVPAIHDLPMRNEPAPVSVPDAAATCRTRSLLMPEAALTGSELRRALDEHDLGLQYQPKVACDDERLIVGVEALIRWNHPELGLLLPDRILPLAERSCLLTEVTDFTITEAIHQYSIWRARGIDLPISVNLAPGLIKDGGFPERLLSSLSQFNVPPARLTLEVKETHSVADRDLCIDVFERLRGAGVGLALDDYGIGLSSLTEFYKLPFSEVKIDGRLIKDAAYSASARTILRAIVRLAHELSIHATAESVETRAEFACVHAAGCDSAQGDLLCAPQPPPGLEQFLTGRRACFATAQSWSPFAVQPAVTQ